MVARRIARAPGYDPAGYPSAPRGLFQEIAVEKRQHTRPFRKEVEHLRISGDGRALKMQLDLHPGEFLVVAFAAPASLASVTIFGRNGCCKDRDSYTIEIFRGADSIYSGTLDARSGFGTISFVPEPATWGLMVAGFGLTGFALRRKSVTTPA